MRLYKFIRTIYSQPLREVSISLHYDLNHSLASLDMDKFLVRKKDAKAPPAPNTNASDADLPPLKYTSLALVRTWAQILFGVSQVTGAHSWFRSALGCILGVTVFCPYVKTVMEYCIDRILSVFKEMGVNLLKGGETVKPMLIVATSDQQNRPLTIHMSTCLERQCVYP